MSFRVCNEFERLGLRWRLKARSEVYLLGGRSYVGGWGGGAEPHLGGGQKEAFILGGLRALINYKAESPSDGSSGRPTGNLLSNTSEKK